jgi:Ca2+-binding RTX toxin-like protein
MALMKRTLHKRLAGVGVAAALSCMGLVIPLPASAGVVHVEGSVVVFVAGNNEVNTVVVNLRGSALDQGTGQFVQGFTVSDSTASIFSGPGCRAFSGTAVCDVQSPTLVSLDLRDKNDKVSQQEREPGDVVPMRVKGGPGNDVLTGGSLGDNLDGELGDDTISGGAGNDVLEGGLGTDTIVGGGGTDTISGGLGKDTIDAKDGERDAINCGLGHDVVTADAADTKKRCN